MSLLKLIKFGKSVYLGSAAVWIFVNSTKFLPFTLLFNATKWFAMFKGTWNLICRLTQVSCGKNQIDKGRNLQGGKRYFYANKFSHDEHIALSAVWQWMMSEIFSNA